jgi:hypothetical protein
MGLDSMINYEQCDKCKRDKKEFDKKIEKLVERFDESLHKKKLLRL